jgi:CheY-like chemotaxis protein
MEEYQPDLIILDLVMPGMDGYQFLDDINQRGVLEKVKVIVISAFEQTVKPVQIPAIALTRGGGLPLTHFIESLIALSKVFTLPD